MAIAGLWHGPSWVFVLWGLAHGILLVVERVLARTIGGFWDTRPRAKATLSLPLTLVAVILCWVLFRSPDLETALRIYRGMFSVNADFTAVPVSQWQTIGVCIAFAALVIVQVMNRQGRSEMHRFKQFVTSPLTTAVLFTASLLYLSRPADFIYFQF